jgi:hypothetical protein
LLAQPAGGKTIKESSTGARFSGSVKAAGQKHQLTGVGVRTKTVFEVNVYAVGLYVDRGQAKSQLASFKGKGAGALMKDGGLRSGLLKPTLGKTLRLVMARDVDGEDMQEAFDDSLRPRLKKAASQGHGGGAAQLAKFKTFFSVDELTEGSELVFSCVDGKLSTKIAGKAEAALDAAALCWALFDIYVGADPIAEEAKANMIRGLAKFL